MEKIWRIVKTISKKSIFLFSYLLTLVGFLALSSYPNIPLPLAKWINGNDIIICILSLIFLLIFSLAMTNIARERLSHYNNMNGITNKINKVSTGDRVAWYYMYAK